MIDRPYSSTHAVTLDGRDEQQEEFKEMIPKVEYILDEMEDYLTDQEERWLYDYWLFITNRSASCSHVIIDKAKTIVNYLGRLQRAQ